MATESDLRNSFRDEPGGRGGDLGSIDTDAVIRRARARRRPRQLLLGAATALVVAGVVVPLVALGGSGGLGVATAGGSAAESATDESGSAGSGEADTADPLVDPASKRAPADRLNLCSGTLAEVVPAPSGVVATVDFPAVIDSPTPGTPIEGTVTLTNTGESAVSGFTGSRPAITLSQGGLVLWHSNGPTTMMAVVVDLAPGASMQLSASFEAVRCDVADDSADGFRADLPAVPSGEYQLSAALDLTLDLPPAAGQSSEAGLELVTGPAAPVRIG